ncbi:hypothetical protein [Aestuariivivens sediminis]|uniref:hypothetical protein n=1 Tax=Aestuariivivens sediminis TaxID=2913557 RepID=UPI001F5A011B|nr:hypothetical protein [Aestuariivivens sediminis]
MLASDRKRGKENMAAMSTEKFNRMVRKGYHHQSLSNVFQLNNEAMPFQTWMMRFRSNRHKFSTKKRHPNCGDASY